MQTIDRTKGAHQFFVLKSVNLFAALLLTLGPIGVNNRHRNCRIDNTEISMPKPAPGTTVDNQAVTYGVHKMHRHLLLCAGPECVPSDRGEAAWTYLKKRLAELRLDQAPTQLFRTKAHCLRMCTQGPIVVVQPDGVWYHSADPPVIERILQEHVLQGRVVREYAFAEAPLDGGIALRSQD
jgi:(2Fe-2S) ferredoxin